MKVFKFVTKIVMSAAIALSSISSNAGPTPTPVPAPKQSEANVSVDAKAFRAEFEGIVYSIENMEKVLYDLNNYQLNAAARGMSQSVFETMFKRLAAAIDLMSVIYADVSLDMDKRRQMLSDLYKAIGSMVIRIAYHQGQDQSDAQLEQISLNPNLGRTNPGKEILMDIQSLFTFRESANNEKVWRVSERIRRDELAQNVIRELQKFARETYPKLEEGKGIRQATKEIFGQQHPDSQSPSLADAVINIRSARVDAQYNAAAIYLGIAFVGFFFPLFDGVGLMERIMVGTRSDNSVFMSSLVYATFWLTAAATKFRSTSQGTLREMLRFKSLIMNPAANGEITADLDQNRVGMVRRVVNFVGKKCEVLLGGGKKVQKN